MSKDEATRKRNKRSVAAEKRFGVLAVKHNVFIEGPYINNRTPILIRCAGGHVTSVRPANVLSGQGWCIVCAQKDPVTAEKNFHRQAAQDGVTLEGLYVNTKTPVRIRCPQGHVGYPRPANVLFRQGSWCLQCGGRDSGVAEKAWRTMAARAGVTLEGPYHNNHTPVKIRCAEGHIGFPRPGNVLHRRGGWCSQCRNIYDRIYLVANDKWGKIGIASNTARVRDHERRGWVVHRQWLNLDHNVVCSVEARVKKQMRDRGWPHKEKGSLVQGGATETFPVEQLAIVEKWIVQALEVHTRDGKKRNKNNGLQATARGVSYPESRVRP